MKIIFQAFSRNLLVTLSTILIYGFSAYGQDNIVTSNTNDLRVSVNSIKEKASYAYSYAQQAYNATTIAEARTSAKQLILLFEETQNIIKKAQTSLSSLSTQENKDKCGKYLNAIASDLVDLQNKTEWAVHKANEIIPTEDFANVKPAATAIITEIEKITTIVSESITHITLADQKLTYID